MSFSQDHREKTSHTQSPGSFLGYASLAQVPGSVMAYVAENQLCDVDDFASWTWQINHQIRSAVEAEKYLFLSKDYQEGFSYTEELFEAGVTPYYATLAGMIPGEALRLQAFPLRDETSDPYGQQDPLAEKRQSPVPEVVHIYPDRVAFCVAQLCPVYCRYCFRKRRDGEPGLHFNKNIIKRGLSYIASQKSIRDVLITGGDPFLAHDKALEDLLVQLRSIKHVEVIRFGTRTPVTLPYRITPELCAMLQRFHPLWLNTHFNCHEELTVDAMKSLELLVSAGIPVGNQSVLLRGINDSHERMMALCRKLIRCRVRPYYVFHAHLVSGTAHLRVPIERGLKIMQSLRGKLSGYGIPLYILDTPSGKIPLSEQPILGLEGNDVLVQDLHGALWREKNAWKDPGALSSGR